MKKNLNYKFIIKVIIITTFFKPLAVNSLTQYSVINKIWDILRILVWIYVLFDTFFIKKKISKSVNYIILLEVVFFTATILKGGLIKDFLTQAVSIITFCMLVSNEIQDDILEFCKAWFYGLSILICIHTFLGILYPNGLGYDTVYYNSIYFLGNKNGLIKFLMPAIVSGVLMSEIRSGKIEKKVWFIILLSLWICINMDSITSLMGIIICLFVFLLRKLKFADVKFNFQKIFLITFILMMVTTVIEISSGFNSLLNVFINENKMQNYIDRIAIWQEALNMIYKSPIIGYGMPRNGGHILINGKYFYSHNGYLEILLYGGVIGFVFFTFVLKKFMFVKSKFINNYIVCVAGGIVGFLIMMLTETHIFTLSFWGFVVIYDYLCNKSQKDYIKN